MQSEARSVLRAIGMLFVIIGAALFIYGSYPHYRRLRVEMLETPRSAAAVKQEGARARILLMGVGATSAGALLWWRSTVLPRGGSRPR